MSVLHAGETHGHCVPANWKRGCILNSNTWEAKQRHKQTLQPVPTNKVRRQLKAQRRAARKAQRAARVRSR